MLLFEDYNELHKINRVILDKLISTTSRSDKSKLKYMNSYYGISNNSKIYIDTLKRTEGGKSIHTWKHATEVILSNDDVAGIVLRSNKRQLLGIFKRGSTYKLIPSQYAIDLNSFNNLNLSTTTSETSSLISVRNKMAGVVKAFIEEHPNAKKNWDIMIVMKDKNIDDLTTKREAQKANVEVKPNEKGYIEYIGKLKDNLQQRLEFYVNNKMKNVKTVDELKQIIDSDPGIFVKKIKVAGLIYELSDMSSDISRSQQRFGAVATYKIQQPKGVSTPDYYYTFYETRNLVIRFDLEGRQFKLSKISFYPSDKTFEQGMVYIAEIKKEKGIKEIYT